MMMDHWNILSDTFCRKINFAYISKSSLSHSNFIKIIDDEIRSKVDHCNLLIDLRFCLFVCQWPLRCHLNISDMGGQSDERREKLTRKR